MKKLREKLRKLARNKKVAIIPVLSVMVCALCAVGAHAEGETTGSAGVASAVTSALQQTSNDALSIISSVLPYALAIVGAVLVVTIGVRVFKKISGR